MAMANGNGKAPAAAQLHNNAVGLITVQPPRREDLQPSYAKILQGDPDSSVGSYASMSMSTFQQH